MPEPRARPRKSDLSIAPMSADDLRLALDWAAAEGWNPGLEDAEAFRAADPEGFLMGRRGDTPVSCISVVRHADDFGFLGFYICRPEHRGAGHGWAIWQAGLARLGDRTVGLDGVVDQQENYRRSGFVLAHRTRRMTGRLEEASDPALRPAAAEDLPAMRAFDRAATGVDRPNFLDAWFAASATRRTLVEMGPEGPVAQGTIRRCRAGCKVGPLFARSEADALRLLRGLAALFPRETLILDVPETAPAFFETLSALGFTPDFETARMYRGPAPARDDSRIFAEATLELG